MLLPPSSGSFTMAPTRPRGVEDSRSETSSLITNLKDRSLLGPAGNSAVAKGKRVASNTQNTHPGLPSYAKNGTSGTATTPAESDQNTARVRFILLHRKCPSNIPIVVFRMMTWRVHTLLTRFPTDTMAYTASFDPPHLPLRPQPTNRFCLCAPTCGHHTYIVNDRPPFTFLGGRTAKNSGSEAACPSKRHFHLWCFKKQGQRA